MDPISEIGVFVQTADLQSFTRAASRLGMTPSGVSRIISRLEQKLGIRLMNRTTRSLSLTVEGAEYFERCSRILAELEEANAQLARAKQTPHGRLRVDLPIALADFVIGPALPRFVERYPEVILEASVRDALIDPTAEGVDVVVRMAPVRDTELVARRLAPARSVLVASPRYVERRGVPASIAALQEHDCITYLSSSGPLPWRLREGDEEVSLMPRARLSVGSGNLLTVAALEGVGIAQTFEHHVAAELERGNLVALLPAHEPEPRTIRALFARQKAELPKVRVFVDFLAELFKPSTSAKKRTSR